MKLNEILLEAVTSLKISDFKIEQRSIDLSIMRADKELPRDLITFTISTSITNGLHAAVMKALQYEGPTKYLPRRGNKNILAIRMASGKPIDEDTDFKGTKIWFLFKLGVSISQAKEILDGILKKVVDKIIKLDDEKRKYKEGEPERKKEYAKVYAERRKLTQQQLIDQYGSDIVKRVTIRQIGGDDKYSWCVLVDRRVWMNGLSYDQALYYKRDAYDMLQNLHPSDHFLFKLHDDPKQLKGHDDKDDIPYDIRKNGT